MAVPSETATYTQFIVLNHAKCMHFAIASESARIRALIPKLFDIRINFIEANDRIVHCRLNDRL